MNRGVDAFELAEEVAVAADLAADEVVLWAEE